MAGKAKNKQDEIIERLTARIELLEKRLEEKKAKDEKKGEKDTTEKWADSLTDAGNTILKESGKILRGFVDATVETLSEAANALASLSDDTDTEKIGEVPGAMVSVMRRSIDIQKKALDKFEESYKKDD